ncbi:hypothetical protein TSTA_023170 [Talaromyces stipitatus ATCC 10500]|uniref:Uncharacterized protein n=1 Tax=Talaromyces stipitatus (strain ATCC 10500 / CBS 375.48 / QM 6759 / NRRL 1006) TaxID=441959 RepID=B8MEY0_TALSN|nr:uncharacterized protein TSTA_023170 [Talaromyces stipitatus ATCC 10500]EED17263.1 hypothetical protein TSTA_023170 [Talaromyces stipitatus ATCC 10500]
MSFDWRKPDPPRKFTVNEKNARVWVKQFQEIWDFARGNLEIAQQCQKKQANKHRREVDFDVGDEVMKLADQAAGPYKIIEKVGQAYRLKLDEGIKIAACVIDRAIEGSDFGKSKAGGD